jgi:hypothetical protein
MRQDGMRIATERKERGIDEVGVGELMSGI